MALSKEQMKLVESSVPTIGYILANYKRFGDDALRVASEYFFNLGKSTGQRVKQKMRITGTDTHAVAAVLNAVIEPVYGKGLVRVEDNKVITETSGFCPVMEAAKILNAPWEIMCRNYSWRVIDGVLAAVNPNAMHEVPESRSRGKNRCLDIITIPK